MNRRPDLFDPDLELAAARILLAQIFPSTSPEERQEVLAEAGRSLAAVGHWLQTDESWGPWWPH